jgi:uncharacterized protein
MHFIVTARDRPGSGELRAANRPAHLEHAGAHDASIVVAGALLDEDGAPKGSLFIFRAPDKAAVEEIMAADPYARAGLFETVTIEPWRWTINRPEGEE